MAVASSSAAFPASSSSWAVDGNTVACRTRERVYAMHVMIHIIFPCASPWLAEVFFVFIAVNFAQCISNQTTRSAPLWKCMVFCHYSCLVLILVFFVFFYIAFLFVVCFGTKLSAGFLFFSCSYKLRVCIDCTLCAWNFALFFHVLMVMVVEGVGRSDRCVCAHGPAMMQKLFRQKCIGL